MTNAFISADNTITTFLVTNKEFCTGIFFLKEGNRKKTEDLDTGKSSEGNSTTSQVFCGPYFPGCNETLTGLNGTFHSPNYPNRYPDGQYCSWRITVSPAQQIHLTFTAFNLQNENNTDALYVYDGENSTGEVLGVFYGNHTPPIEGINSSSNHMFLIFKSDKKISYTGFSALYKAVDCLGNHCNPSSQISKLTPSLIMPYSFATTFSSDIKLTRKSSIRRLITTSQKIDSPMTSNKISTSKGVVMVVSLSVTKVSTRFSAAGKSVMMMTSKTQPFVASSTKKAIVTSISTELVPTSSKIQLASSSSVTGPVFTSGMKLFNVVN